MDNENVVIKIRKIIDGLILENGSISLAMLIIGDSSSEKIKYDLLLSAPWLDNKSPREGTNYIVNKIRNNMGHREFTCLRRITLIKTSDSFVKTVNSLFSVKNSIININNCRFNEYQIDNAIIMESSK